MNILFNFIINIVLSIIDLFLIEYCITKRNHINKIKFNIFLFIEVVLLFILNTNYLNHIIANVILYVIIIYISLYRHLKKLVLVEFMPYFLTITKILSEIIILITFEWIFNTSISVQTINWVTPYTILFNFVFRYFEYAIIFYYLNHKNEIKSIHYFKIITICISLYFCASILLNTKKLFYFQNIGRTFVFIIIIYNVALIAFDRYQTKHERIEMQMIQTQERILAEKKYIEKMNDADEDMRRMRHDLKNSYYIIHAYANENNIKDIKRFIESKVGKLNEFSALIHIGHKNIDSFIDEKINTMKEKNIQYSETIGNVNIGNIEVSDLSLLIGLALDNAIEAAEKVDGDREIHFSAKNRHHYLILHFSNSIIPGSQPLFSKTNKLDNPLFHGYGVKGIKQYAKMYNGEAKYITEYDKVTLRILLSTK